MTTQDTTAAMTGAQHYREAQRLLEAVAFVDTSGRPFYGQSADEMVVHLPQILAAQVHATLALVAASLPGDHDKMIRDLDRAWTAAEKWRKEHPTGHGLWEAQRPLEADGDLG